jgi:hypothetical protein
VEHDPVFGVGNKDDSAHTTGAKEKKVYKDEDISHMYVWCKEAHVNILTVPPEMGLAHRHLTVEPCVKGTKKDTRDIYTGYFMCLAPEDEDSNAADDEDEYAIEAISLTWEKGEETTASALVRNPSKKKNKKVSSVSQGSRADGLFNERVSKGKPSPTESKYNRPHEPKAVNPGRTVK